ncbi:MAG: hypothetical protein ABJE95_28160 [Byssovorax sp.]
MNATPYEALFAVKLVVYVGVLGVAAWRWGAALKGKWPRILLGGLARFALGAIVGIPAGLILRDQLGSGGGFAFYALYFTLRFLLWLLVLRVAFLEAPLGEVAGLATAGAVLNAGLDLALPDSLMSMFYINLC